MIVRFYKRTGGNMLRDKLFRIGRALLFILPLNASCIEVTGEKGFLSIQKQEASPPALSQNGELLLFADKGNSLVRENLSNKKYDAVSRMCFIAPGGGGLAPTMTAKSAYANDYESAQKLGVLGIEVVKAPKHATYEIRTTDIDENGKTVPMVYPEYRLIEWDGYLGADRAEFLVKLSNGKTVLVVYDIFWTNQPTDSFNQCPPTKLQYKQMRELQRRERLEQAANDLKSDRRMTYGICYFASMNRSEPDYGPARVNSLPIQQSMRNFLSKELRDLYSNRDLPQEESDWLYDWESSFNIKLLNQPLHGEIVRGDSNSHYYSPNVGYTGKDTVDFLVTWKDDKGRPISMKLFYYINVMEQKSIEKIVIDKQTYLNGVKKYCGTNSGSWRISDSQLNEEIYQKYLSSGSADFSA